jgi:hypothetical protein
MRIVMIDKAHLRDKQVLFRIHGMSKAYSGVVKFVENDGFWIHADDLLVDLKSSGVLGALDQLHTPVLFVPTAALLFLIAAPE